MGIYLNPSNVGFKLNSTPFNALAQIKTKEYFHAFDYYQGRIIFVGIEEFEGVDCKLVMVSLPSL